MATTVNIINGLYDETIKRISQDSSNWQDFLKTASMNYTNSFSEQILIYAQRPEAVACAEINTWNNTYKRLINRGTPGIGLLTEYGGRFRIRYVWGIDDTHSIYGRKGKKLKIWKVSKAYEDQVIESLENRFGELDNKEDFVNAVKSVAINLTEDNYFDYLDDLINNKDNTRLEHIDNDVIERKYKEILKNSIAYMIINRSGINPAPYFDYTDFIEIPMFQDIDTIARLGTAVSDISEMGIREIYVSLKNIRIAEIDKIRTFESKKDLVYDDNAKANIAERSDFNENNLQESRELFTTESSSERGNRFQDGQILTNEARLLEREQERDLSGNVNERYPNISLERDRNNSSRENRNDYQQDERELESNRGIESIKSNEMGRYDEQYQESSRGSSNERTNLQLEDDENTRNGVLFSNDDKYLYRLGDHVFIDDNEYIIQSLENFNVFLYLPSYPSGSKTINVIEFENILSKNNANNHLKVDYQEDGLNFETITPIKDVTDDEYYTIARVMSDSNCVELHSNNGKIHIEIGTKLSEDNWENELEDAKWFNKDLTDEQVLTKLKEIFDNKFKDISQENYYGEYNDEVDLVEHILSVHKIDDITVAFNSNDNIAMWDEDNTWEGKEVYDFILDELLVYNEDGTADLIDNSDLKRLQEYRLKYENKIKEQEELLGKKVVIDNKEYSVDEIGGNIVTLRDNSFQKNGGIPQYRDIELDEVKDLISKQENITQESTLIPTEKEKKITPKQEVSQLSLFATREQELADRIVDIFNSFDTKYKGTFYIDDIELKKWDHISSNKRNLSIYIKSNICTEYADKNNSFTYFNEDKTDEIKIREYIETHPFLKYLNEDKDFSIIVTPDSFAVYYNKFDDKTIDLSIGRDEVLSSINDNDNIEIIDNPINDIVPKVERKPREKLSNYVLHPEIPYEERINYKITDNNLGVGTDSERFRNNIDAIKTLKKCEEENRYATPEEQEILARYVGWGGLSNAFDKDKWESAYEELNSILTPEEFKHARDTVTTAFYTPPIVIKSMYKALENMGLEKGNILEPSCGIGNFIGLLPNNDKLKIYGVEKDDISGRIARQLYQKSSIAIKGFEEINHSNSFFDVVIGNVPFGDERVYDKKYDKLNFLIHDYFFAKTIDKVRPGGVIAFITSQGTMDKKSDNVRKYIAQRANLLGAIRLPNNTFKASAGTTITTDIIFLQKRDSITDIVPEWVNLDTNEDGITINKYFVDNPNMVLGKMEMVSNQYGGYSPTCLPYQDQNLEELLDNAITNINAEIKDYQLDELEEEDLSVEADLNIRNFSFTIVDDKVYYRENSRMYPQDLSVTAANRVKGLIELRDITREIIDLQLNDYLDEDIQKAQDKLNEKYDLFTKKYGLINSRGNSSVFSSDSSYFLLCSLEILDENGNLSRKADLFTKRTIKPHTKSRVVESANDALLVSIADKARVDISYMQSLCKIDMDKMLADLEGQIFRVPEYGESNKWVTADEYLSGNVREKLKIAEEFVSEDSEYKINVEYLKRVLPKDIPTSEINVRLGATWLPEDVIKQFMFELLESSPHARQNMNIHYSNLSGEWNIENKQCDRSSVAVTSTYGTNRANAYRLIEDALNLRDTKIFDYVIDDEGKKKAILNRKDTAIAQAKQDKIKTAFNDWIWQDIDRRDRLTKLYNEKFNSIKTREYDGSNITFEGINPEIQLRKHQVNGIARILYGGNTLLAHEVGAGKTFTMVAAAMESKRLGLCNKSLFVVPNHIIEQFASEFLQLYPSANILVSTKKDFETSNRKKFCSKIATGDYDAIIIGHSQFEKIPMSAARQVRILEQQLDDITRGIADLKAHNGEKFSIKMLVKTQKNIEAKLAKLNSQDRKDDVVTFEELGVDRLFVDEAHYYKNLYLYTKMRNVGGIAQTEAQKSSDLYMKCRYLDELTGNKGVIFATGTPVSNTMAELYTMQRYLQYDVLLESNLQHFDAWASTFGETVTAMELAPEGTGYRSKTRFARFYNLPELMTMFKEVADIQTADMLNLPVPKAHYENIVVKPSKIQLDLVQSFAERAEKIRDKQVKPNEDNMLKITKDGRKLSLDQRLINDMLPDNENSKVAICSANVYRIWEENKDKHLTQLIFCDLSTPKNDGSFNVYDDMKKKLVEKGIPEDEIEFIHYANTEVRKKELFSKVRKGQVRALMGSTQKMGAGTNCQDKLIAIHDLDCPWRPADLTQRSGRIIRQGNQNEDVYIYRYVTEKTFDAYLFQLVEQKQRFISQVMTSKTPVRVMEDIDEVALSYAEIKALAAGNPLIIEKTELDTQVSKLKLLKQNYLSEQYSLEDKVKKSYPNQIKYLEKQIESFKNDLNFIKENNFDDTEIKFVSMTINGKVYNDKQLAGQQILEECKKITEKDTVEIGEFKGFKMEIEFMPFFKEYRLYLKNNATYTVELGNSDIGNITRIENALSNINSKLESAESDLENNKIQLEKAKSELGKPFAQEQELKEKIKKLNEVNSLLKMDEKTYEIMDETEDVENDRQMYKKDYER